MPFLEMRDVHKRFGGVVALDGASLSAEPGELHALLGANGSGKSTLNKTLTGVVAADRAEVLLDGQPVTLRGPREAQARGISAVYQELSLVPDLSVEDNVALGVEPARFGFVDRREQRRTVRGVVERFGSAFEGRVPLDTPVAGLPPGEQQIVEICKAVARDPRILVLDEATASLHEAQVRALFEALRDLKDRGVLVIFTSHRLEEVFELCDRATVLRSGATVGTVELAAADQAEVVRMMLGRSIDRIERDRTEAPEARRVVLEVRGLITDRLRDVSFTVETGEVLGVAGLQGQGQDELLEALFGAARISSGEVRLDGKPIHPRSPRQAVRERIALIPGERAREGLFSRRPILENLTLASVGRRALPGGLLRGARERRAAGDAVRRLQIKLGRLLDPVLTLSGGNQQKVVVGRWLLTEPRVILMDDPTKGIDVGAKEELYSSMRRLADEGVAIVFHSSENLELVRLCGRVLVLFEGRLVQVLEGDQVTEDRLLEASVGVDQVPG